MHFGFCSPWKLEIITMKLIILSVMVACAMSMKMDMSMISGLMSQAQNLMGNMDPESIKGLMDSFDPKMMTDLIGNMPPQMREMMEGMGISKDDLETAAKELPQHMDEVKAMLGGFTGGDGKKLDMLSQVKAMIPPEMTKDLEDIIANPEKREEIMKEFKEQATEALKEIGLTTEDLTDMSVSGILPKLMAQLRRNLKEEGVTIDLENPEEIKKELKKYIYEEFGFSEDEDPEKIKEVLGEFAKANLAPLGIEFDIDNPMASIEQAKTMILGKAKDFGIDIKEGATGAEIKEALFGKMKDLGIDLSNPSSLINFGMKHMDMIKMFLGPLLGGMGGQQQQQQPMPMPVPMPMQQQPVMQPMGALPLNLNLEINLDQPPSVAPEYMRGSLSDEAVEELLQDLIHYRMQARNLMARNQMLEREIAAMRTTPMIPMTKSPFINRVLHKCRHHM